MDPQGLDLYQSPYVVHILQYGAVFQVLCSIFYFIISRKNYSTSKD